MGIISKVPILRSPTAAARGGIAAVLNRTSQDSPKNHAADTVRAGAGLSDVKAVNQLCQRIPEEINWLARRGLPFTHENNNIAQRPFAGHKKSSGKPAQRSCFAGDRTGQLLLHTLYDHCLNQPIKFYEETPAVQLIRYKERIRGVIGWDIAAGEPLIFLADNTLLATGGAGQLYEFTTNPLPSTGDGQALAVEAGYPLKDPEFFQFHPTALARSGILITGAARSAGGILRNKHQQRFMQQYDPENLDTAERDRISQAITSEIAAGRGDTADNCVWLDLTGLSEKFIRQQLPEVYTTCRDYLKINPARQQIPVKPAAHYWMGGLPTNLAGQVLNRQKQPVPGLWAAGETACLSIHGANRLGTNSLAETLVMGKTSGEKMVGRTSHTELPTKDLENQLQTALKKLCFSNTATNKVDCWRQQLQTAFGKQMGIVREAEGLNGLLAEIDQLTRKVEKQKTDSLQADRRYRFDLIRLLELKNMLRLGRLAGRAALARQESRGSHYRADHPEQNDIRYQAHSIIGTAAQQNKIFYDRVKTE